MSDLSEISLVVPVYSGQDYLEKLVEEVEKIVLSWEAENSPIRLTELILVDDEAIDNSGSLIDEIAEQKSWVTSLHLSRNFGQHAATIAGILHSSGSWVVTLDEDLQHKPEQIEKLLLHAVKQNCDVVYARPMSQSVHGKAWRDQSSRRFKKLMEWLTGTPTLNLVNSFRLIRGPVARATASVITHNTYFDIALTWFTQRISALDIEMQDDRFSETGKSGYNLRKLIIHAQKMMFSSQLRFLSMGIWIGVFLFLFSSLTAIYFFVVKLVFPESIAVEGWASTIIVLCASTGLISVMVGLCLQYVSTLVLKAHGRPTFFTLDRANDKSILPWLEARVKASSTNHK